MTTILLARHGETDWNRDRRWQGHADPPLNAAGRAQARALAVRLAGVPIEAVYASDLRRAIETAEAVAATRSLPVATDPLLREIDVGEWSGLTTAEIVERFPVGYARHEAGGDGWEDGEPHAAMSARIVAAVTRIARSHTDAVLFVIHGGTIRALLAAAAGVELTEHRRTERGAANGTVCAIELVGGRLRLDGGATSAT